MDDVRRISFFRQDADANHRVFIGTGVFFVIEVVQQPGDAPQILVLPEFAGIGPHCRFDCQHMLDKVRVLCVFA